MSRIIKTYVKIFHIFLLKKKITDLLFNQQKHINIFIKYLLAETYLAFNKFKGMCFLKSDIPHPLHSKPFQTIYKADIS